MFGHFFVLCHVRPVNIRPLLLYLIARQVLQNDIPHTSTCHCCNCFNELLSESENYLIASQWDWCALWKTEHICCWEGCSFRTFLIVLSVEYFIVNGWLKITLKLSLQMSKINNKLRDDDHFNSRVSYLFPQCSASLAVIVNCQYKNWSFISLGPKVLTVIQPNPRYKI